MPNRIIPSLALFILLSPLAMAQSYFPLEKGSEMTYQYTKAFSPQGETKMIMRVKEDERTIKGQDYLEINTTVNSNGNSGFSNSSFARMTEKGWMGLMSESSTKEEMMMPSEFEVGQSWTTAQGKVEIIDLGGSVSTPGGDFADCLVLKTSFAGGSSLSYYQSGTGMVAMAMDQGGKSVVMAYLVE